MKIGTPFTDLGELAVELLIPALEQRLFAVCPVNPVGAQAIIAARVVTELPNLEWADGKQESIGRLIAARVLHGRTLIIAATDAGIVLRLDEEVVSENTLRRVLDFDLFAMKHAEWWFEANDADYQFGDSGQIKLEGTNLNWGRYYDDSQDEAS